MGLNIGKDLLTFVSVYIHIHTSRSIYSCFTSAQKIQTKRKILKISSLAELQFAAAWQ